MADKESEYVKDPRIACKYGTKCYQRNEAHHKKYKHPPSHKIEQRAGHVNKKIKIESANEKINEIATSNDVSDSEDYNIEDDSDTSAGDIKDRTSDAKLLDEEKPVPKEDESKKTEKKDIEASVETLNSNKGDGENEKKDTENTEGSSKQNQMSKDNDNCLSSNSDYKHFIKQKFLVDMPEDFYQFWDWCKKIKPLNPVETLKGIGLTLVGPFDVLAGKFDNVDKPDEKYLLHWRYYHDPPEFQTVLKGDDKTGYHIGYFRDSPDELPVFLVANSSKKNGILNQIGANIFAAVNMYLEDLKKTGDPFKKMQIGRIQASIKKEAERLKLDLSPKTNSMISREKKIVSRTFNKIGLVVPYDKKTQLGYRELALDNKALSTLFTKLQNALPEQRPKFLSELQPVFTYASIAADECDFGTGIELGWNIISHGVDCLDSTALRSLTTNYRLLNREAFAKIAEVHMLNRKKGCDLSII